MVVFLKNLSKHVKEEELWKAISEVSLKEDKVREQIEIHRT